MEQLQANRIIQSAVHYGGIYQQISIAMKAHGISDLGDVAYRDKCGDRFKDKHGEIRSASLDLGIPDRADRTAVVRYMSETELDVLHTTEKREGRFLVGTEIRRITKNNSRPTIISEERKNYLEKFNNENRPEMRSVYGVRVPAYFPPDHEFDGMEYHHAWDKNVKLGFFELPELKMKKTGRRLLDVEE